MCHADSFQRCALHALKNGGSLSLEGCGAVPAGICSAAPAKGALLWPLPTCVIEMLLAVNFR